MDHPENKINMVGLLPKFLVVVSLYRKYKIEVSLVHKKFTQKSIIQITDENIWIIFNRTF
ncbi:hypothetical protein RI543_002600 [Arxiozyma heterogenica]|uniref:Uncharacterized protein n=1 Tax=Arxiozyma heterogenica TaxID=278026 RepID=A0AAN7ZSJ3_9SACH|nr:hypothetical protein RI543_002600 [Kazachstania heterogenica]